MKIIIEGVDGVGKTTLAKKIAELFNLEYCHDSKPRTFEEYKHELTWEDDKVYDRFFFGQFAGYQSESERLLDYRQLEELIHIAKEQGVVIIVCYDKVNRILKRFKHNDSDIEWMNKTGFKSVRAFIKSIQDGFLKIAKLGGDYINYIDMSRLIPNEQ